MREQFRRWSERVLDLPDRHRRVWHSGDVVQLELRDPEGELSREFGEEIWEQLTRLPGVEAACVVAPLHRVLVRLRADAPSIEEISEVIERVEAAAGVADQPFPQDGLEHPGDAEPVLRTLLSAGADLAGLGLALTGRALRFTPGLVQLDAAIVTSLFDNVPPLRRGIERRLGPRAADLALGATAAMAQGFAQGPLGPLVDLGSRTLLLAERLAGYRAWQSAGDRTVFPDVEGQHVITTTPDERPAPLRRGLAERYMETAWWTSVAAAGATLVGSRSLERATAALSAGLPRAARSGTDAFSAQLGRALPKRDLLVLAPHVLRLLDRVDHLVIDAELLSTGEHEIVHTEPMDGIPEAELHNVAVRLLDRLHPDRTRRKDGWTLASSGGSGSGVLPSVLTLEREGTLRALVEVRPVLAPAAATLVESADAAGLRITIVARPDRWLPALEGADVVRGPIGERIRERQGDGAAVMAIGRRGSRELEVADCAVTVTERNQPVPWTSHVVCFGALEELVVMIEATAHAKRASRHSVTVAGISGVAAMTLAATGVPGSTRRVMTIVNLAAIVSMANGIRLGSAAASTEAPQRMPATEWHELDTDEILARLGTTDRGLPQRLIVERTVAPERAPPIAARALSAFADELVNPLFPVLGAGAGVAALTGSVSDAAMILIVLGANAAIGATQRVRAELATERLATSGPGTAAVVREGERSVVDVEALVVGDLVVLREGDAVPADVRLIDVTALEIDESGLTGESIPVPKHVDPTPGAPVADRASMAYEGTWVVSGTARGVIVAIGKTTEARRALAASEHEAPRGAEARLEGITAKSVPLAIGGAAISMGIGLIRRQGLAQMLPTAVNLAVASIPEGLPTLMTLAQLAAARRLSREGVLVRRPQAMESLGRVDVVAADKTGTLTQGRVQVRLISTGSSSRRPEEAGDDHRAVLAGALRATAQEATRRSASSTDASIRRAAGAAHVDETWGAEGWEPRAELPFEPNRALHAVAGATAGNTRLAVKGAPEVLLDRCAWQRRRGERRRIDDAAWKELRREVDNLADNGLRVLAVAERPLGSQRELTEDAIEELELLGFIGLADSVRGTAAISIERLRAAGIRVLMITGDHPSTASAIARELDLLDGGSVVTGGTLAELSDRELDSMIGDVSVFARVTPAQKVRILASLQRTGSVVAMTGDGTNDAPAMRLADVGIAIGANATEAAKEASDLVVVDERIETLVNGVVEGRAMWASLKEGIAILVGGNLGEVVFTLAGQAIGGTPPVNARQLLLVNLFTDVAPALAIALRRPRRTKLEDLLHEGPEASLGRALDQRIVNRAMTTAAAASVAWVLGRATGSPQRASTIATAALVTSQLGQTLATSWHDPTAVGAVALSAVGLVASVQSPGLSGFFGCTPLGPVGWAIPIAVGGMAAGAAVAIGALARREGDGSGSSAALTREPESDGAAVAHDATRRAPTPA